MQRNFLLLKNTKDLLPYNESVVYFIEPRHVKNSKFYKVIVQMEAGSLVEACFFCDLFEAIGNHDLGIASEKPRRCWLACAWLADNQKVINSYLCLHKTIIRIQTNSYKIYAYQFLL